MRNLPMILVPFSIFYFITCQQAKINSCINFTEFHMGKYLNINLWRMVEWLALSIFSFNRAQVQYTCLTCYHLYAQYILHDCLAINERIADIYFVRVNKRR